MGDVVDMEKHKKTKLDESRQKDAARDSEKGSQNKNRFSEHRKKVSKAKKTSDTIKSAISLPKQIEFTNDWPILFPLFFAIIKDLLDWIGFSLPVLNEALNLPIMGLTCLVLILLGSSSKNRKRAQKGVRFMLKWFTMIMGTTAEEFFGLNLLPIESITVIVAYGFVLYERAEMAREEKEAEKSGEAKEEKEEYALAA